VEETFEGAALVELAPGVVGDVPGARVGVAETTEGAAETLFMDSEVMLSADVKEERKTESSEITLSIELNPKRLASAEGL
jgi:uncharacterized glyoxalase superfamily protein PhnB